MFELFKMGLSIQKNLVDAQLKQLEAAEQMFKAAQTQAGAQVAGADAFKKLAEQQRSMLNGWLGFWSVPR